MLTYYCYIYVYIINYINNTYHIFHTLFIMFGNRVGLFYVFLGSGDWTDDW